MEPRRKEDGQVQMTIAGRHPESFDSRSGLGPERSRGTERGREHSPLAESRDPAREAALRSALGTRRIGRMVYAYGVVASTMDLAHGLAAADRPGGTPIIPPDPFGRPRAPSRSRA